MMSATSLSRDARAVGNGDLDAAGAFPAVACAPAGVLRSEHASTQASAAQNFFRSMNLVDAYGEFMGGCSKGEEAVRDVDSDCDTLPDACDPCPYQPDGAYRTTGRFGAPFADASGALVDDDGDGVPNVCDDCPSTPNPLVSVPGPAGGPRARLPPVACGAANVAVTAHLEQADADADGLGDACDRCELLDPVCCTTDADCNPRADRGTKCRPTPQGVAWGPIVIGGAGGHPCQGGSMCEASLDSDTDGVGDRCDRCPRQWDPTQADGDGIGDACDTCPAFSDASLGGLVACPVPVPGQAPSIAASDLGCVLQTKNPAAACVRLDDGSGACSFGKDADQDGVGDLCDNCRVTPNTDQANCNYHIEEKLGVAFPFVGDMCDREPCARVVADSFSQGAGTGGPPADQWVTLRLDPILLPSGAPGAYPTSPFVAPRVDLGLRACDCMMAPGTTGSAADLASGCSGTCPFEPGDFGSSVSWQPIDVVPSTETADPPAGTNLPPGTFLTDSIYPKRPLSTPDAPSGRPSFVAWDVSRFPGAHVLGTTNDYCTAGYGLTGVMWTSAQQLTSIPAANTVDQLGHHYAGGTLGWPMKCHPGAPTGLAPCFLCGDACPSCNMKELGFLTIAEMEQPGYDPPAYVWGIDGAQRFVEQVDDGVRLAISATGAALLTPTDGFAHRGELLGALVTGGSAPARIAGLALCGGRLSLSGGVIVSPPDGAAAARAGALGAGPPALVDAGVVLSSRERSLFVVGGRASDGVASSSLWQYPLDSEAWHEAKLSGATPGAVLAAVFRSEDRSFYVIDEAKIGPLPLARLLRVSLDDLRVTVMGAWPRLRRFEQTYLSVAEDGELLLASTGGRGNHGRTWLAKLAVGGRHVDLRWVRQERGRLGATPVLSRRGLTAWFEQGVGRFVDAGDLAPRGPGSHTLGDCF